MVNPRHPVEVPQIAAHEHGAILYDDCRNTEVHIPNSQFHPTELLESGDRRLGEQKDRPTSKRLYVLSQALIYTRKLIGLLGTA
jgi:hypothetical protein